MSSVKVTISKICFWYFRLRLCAELCNSNRYGKDKTVVIAMGKGKRQKTKRWEGEEPPRCEKIPIKVKGSERLITVFVLSNLGISAWKKRNAKFLGCALILQQP